MSPSSSKRAARKGNITKVRNHIKIVERHALRRQNLADLHKRSGYLEEQVSSSEAIQDQIDEVSTAPPIDSEAGELDLQRRLNYKLTCELNCLIQAVSTWSLGNKIHDQIADLDEVPSLVSPHFKSKCQALWTQYEQFQSDTSSLHGYGELATKRDEIRPLIKQLQLRFDDELRAASTPPASLASPPSASSTSVSVCSHRNNSLKTKLPKFSGDILDWRDFWRVFEPLLAKEVGLTDEEKIAHLLESMQGQEALKEARTAAGAHDKYEEVVACLKKTYDHPRVVYKHHVKKLCEQKTVSDSRTSLKDTLSSFRIHRNGLERHKGMTLDQYLTAQVELKMTDDLHREWKLFSSTVDIPPDADMMKAFLEKRANALADDIKLGRLEPFKPKPVKKSAMVMGASSSSMSCPQCSESHNVRQCQKFKALTVSQRQEAVRKAKLCLNCLGRGHNVKDCPSQYHCRECPQRHHTLLHKPSQPTPSPVQAAPVQSFPLQASPLQPTPLQASPLQPSPLQLSLPQSSANELPTLPARLVSPCQHTIISQNIEYCPPTVMARVKAGHLIQEARVLLDSGAAVSLVTSRLANSLKAKRIKDKPLLIQGANAERCHEDVVELELSPVYTGLKRSLSIQDYVTDKIPDSNITVPMSEVSTKPGSSVGRSLLQATRSH